MRGCLLEVVHQDDAFTVLFELLHNRCDDLLGFAHLEVKRVHVGRENADVTLPDIFDQFGRVPQRWETEERPNRLIAERYADGGNAFFNFVFAILLA